MSALQSPLQILQAHSLPSAVQAEIERLILSGALPVGQRINEVALAERFGTSRGPVREALRALEECGIVRAERNRGVFVREVTLIEADEVYDLREVLDEFIGRRLAERIGVAELEALKQLVADMTTATDAGDIPRYHTLNLQFHDALVDAVGNSHLSATYRRLTKELLLYRLRGLTEGGGFAVSVAEHAAIVEAIEARDPTLAGRLLRNHAADSRARMHRAAGPMAGRSPT
jgi:phosphonate utilization transcriptional regulator